MPSVARRSSSCSTGWIRSSSSTVIDPRSRSARGSSHTAVEGAIGAHGTSSWRCCSPHRLNGGRIQLSRLTTWSSGGGVPCIKPRSAALAGFGAGVGPASSVTASRLPQATAGATGLSPSHDTADTSRVDVEHTRVAGHGATLVRRPRPPAAPRAPGRVAGGTWPTSACGSSCNRPVEIPESLAGVPRMHDALATKLRRTDADRGRALRPAGRRPLRSGSAARQSSWSSSSTSLPARPPRRCSDRSPEGSRRAAPSWDARSARAR